MGIVIKVENLGKKYIISHQQERYSALRDVMANAAKKAVKKVIGKGETLPKKEEFWALRNIDFEVNQGDRIGIIGRNGAGKSTLLKLLSKITEPTEGKIKIKGKIASLLEVGTGFHPELTGRENIFLNGAILSMSKKEIIKKIDDIVEFSGVKKFLDTPVKRYSSGMYVRLAFAIAAHLEPDILVIDEVLAVGDMEFQKKCVGKMDEISRGEGSTILFVSHNMGIIRKLCNRALLIDKGKIIIDTDVENAIQSYVNLGDFNENVGIVNLKEHAYRLKGMKSYLENVSLKNSNGIVTTRFTQNENIILKIKYNYYNQEKLAGAGFIINTIDGIRVGGGNTYMKFQSPHVMPDKGLVVFYIMSQQFTPGIYLVSVSLGSHQGVLVDKVENAISFTIEPYDIYNTGYLLTKEDGVVSLNFNASIETIP